MIGLKFKARVKPAQATAAILITEFVYYKSNVGLTSLNEGLGFSVGAIENIISS